LGPGDRLGAYEIVESIGAGGMGEVYRARDARLERDVAIKVLPARLADDPAALARFQRVTTQVFRVELSGGRRVLLRELGARDPAGADSPSVAVTPDGKA
jgi:serine/threonine protein kinase